MSTFHRSSFCSLGDCVEVAHAADGVLVRDSKNPAQHLTFDADEWRAFIAGVKAGEFG